MCHDINMDIREQLLLVVNHFLCFETRSLWFFPAVALQVYKDSPVSASHLSMGTLKLLMHVLTPAFIN